MKVYKLTCLYRDASNYKCVFEKEITQEEATINLSSLKVGDEIEIEQIGSNVNELELIQKYGFGDDDHNILEIEGIEVYEH